MNGKTAILRSVALLLGIALLVWGIDLYMNGSPRSALLILCVEGILIIVGVIFERQRYRPKIDMSTGTWQTTGEKFQDPVTKKMMDVLYNPVTGQRDYVEAKKG
jgi:hypothetical protein